MSIIINLLSILEEKNLKQADLCAAININTSTMTNWKNRNTDPPSKYIIPICDFLNISPYLLCTGEEKKPSSNDKDEDKQRLLYMYSLLSDMEKGEILGELKAMTKYKNKVEEEQRIKESKLIEQHINSVYIDFYNVPVSAGTGIFLNSDDKESLHVKASPEVDQADFCLRISGDSMEPDYTDGEIILIKSCPTVNIEEIGIFIVNDKTYIKKLGKNRLISLNPNYKDISLQENDSVYCMGKVVGALEDDDILE